MTEPLWTLAVVDTNDDVWGYALTYWCIYTLYDCIDGAILVQKPSLLLCLSPICSWNILTKIHPFRYIFLRFLSSIVYHIAKFDVDWKCRVSRWSFNVYFRLLIYTNYTRPKWIFIYFTPNNISNFIFSLWGLFWYSINYYRIFTIS